ncbi:MAG: AAA family ATPase, partial [Bacteroidia bacterium]|nr:AAA family ATPase [Bacteroidia bacterium]
LDRFMFNVLLTYPTFDQEISVVKNTTSDYSAKLDKILSAEEIVFFQQLVRRIPIPDNVVNYAVTLSARTRPNTELATADANEYLSWGAGPRSSQYLVIGAKCHAAFHGKFSPDIDDVKAVAPAILRHRLVRNYKAEAENISVENIISKLLGM